MNVKCTKAGFNEYTVDNSDGVQIGTVRKLESREYVMVGSYSSGCVVRTVWVAQAISADGRSINAWKSGSQPTRKDAVACLVRFLNRTA